MPRPRLNRVTNSPNSHPGRVRTSASAGIAATQELKEWRHHRLVSLLPTEIFLLDPDTRVRNFRLSPSGQKLELSHSVVTLPDSEGAPPFAHYELKVPSSILNLPSNSDTLYVISEAAAADLFRCKALSQIPIGLSLDHFVVPSGAIYDAIGKVLVGYTELVLLDDALVSIDSEAGNNIKLSDERQMVLAL